jgi:small GTP-binding protein
MSGVQVYKFKLVIIGENAVGKTSLARTFVSKQFAMDYRPTIGTNVFVHKILLLENIKITVSLFDIAGQEKWAMMRHIYYKGAQGAFLVGDVTRERSFEDLVDFWYPDFIKYCEGMPTILLANKIDLGAEIDKKKIETIAKNIRAIDIFYTSAKTRENCEDALKKLVSYCIKQI